VAGRTDAGVHARGQVAAFDLTEAEVGALAGRADGIVPLEALVKRLNAVLPHDVRVVSAADAGPAFDARFSALWREYRYRIADDGAAKTPLERGFTWWTAPLDVAAMAEAAAPLVGEHDFTPFCLPRRFASAVRRVLELDVVRPAPGIVEIWIRADAFAQRMVRLITGALVSVGQARRPPHWVGDVLAAGERDSSVQAAPALGLVLERVAYPEGQEALAAQAERARVYRGAEPGVAEP
jgi:tRNA pseudouridine38-40 synthase